MSPSITLAVSILLLGGPIPGHPDPAEAALFAEAAAALEEGRWADAQAKADAAWAAHRAWVSAWLKTYDEIRLESCVDIDRTRARLEDAEESEARAKAAWADWMAALDAPPSDRLGFRYARRPKVIPGASPRCLAERARARRGLLDRRDQAAIDAIEGHIERALSGSEAPPPAACALADRWAREANITHRHDREERPLGPWDAREADAESGLAEAGFARLLRACPATDGSVLLLFATLKRRLGERAEALDLFDRYLKQRPEGALRLEVAYEAVQLCVALGRGARETREARCLARYVPDGFRFAPGGLQPTDGPDGGH